MEAVKNMQRKTSASGLRNLLAIEQRGGDDVFLGCTTFLIKVQINMTPWNHLHKNVHIFLRKYSCLLFSFCQLHEHFCT